ncbi:MAG: choice-of-anchor D domain-containing protein [Verrucomicrobiaceae bacterium]|nr:choice-of-anchor D domain-containing protein [Verrucomicrobiaceae bacterium]
MNPTLPHFEKPLLHGGRSWCGIIFGALWVMATCGPATVSAAPGDLDTTFNGSGKVTTSVGSGTDDKAFSVAVQADGKILVAGYSHNGTNNDFGLVRYTSSGVLDSTFGTGGKVTTSVGSGATGGAGYGVVVQNDGKILVAGNRWNGSNYDFALVRYTSAGVLDGQVTTSFGSSSDDGRSVALQNDGKIIVAGWSSVSNGFALVRYTSAMALDTSFGTGGLVSLAIGGGSGLSVKVQGDGNILVAGYSSNGSNDDFKLVRYTATGTLDTGFGTGGIVTTPIGSGNDQAFSMALQNDGNIVVAGFYRNGSSNDFALVRYTSTGALDTSFGSAGIATNPIGSGDDNGQSVAIQNNGKIIVAGSSSGDFALVRYTSAGALDASFGNSGKVTTPIGSSGDYGTSVAIQNDGNIVAAGYTYTGTRYSFAVVRYIGDYPEIAIEQPAATNLTDGASTIDYGSTAIASAGVTKTFSIRNLGTLDLTGLAVTKSGTNAADFVINTTGMSTSLAPGASTTFSVTFNPLQAGGKNASIQIASNDVDENPFDISLSGAGNLVASFSSKATVPVTSNGFTATGSTVNLTLNYAPTTGDELLVVNNTSLDPINGTFSNLANGQTVTLSYGGVNYDFVAYYYGGEGYNDLVLLWKNRRLMAWGFNSSGQLGDNSVSTRNSPVPVNNVGGTSALAGKDIVSIVTGAFHSLVLCTDGTVLAWGDNGFGQLGDNTIVSPRSVPVAVNSSSGVSALFGKRVVALAAGSYFSAALCSDGTVAAWGSNSWGQLGNGTSGNTTRVPGAVSTEFGQSALFGKRVTQISLGGEYCLALATDGTLVSWGYNSHGGLGDGSQTHRFRPVLVATGSGTSALFGKTVQSVAAGESHNLALCTDGVLTSWGNYGNGRLGDNSDNIFRTSPVFVNIDQGLSALYNKSVATMAGGSSHTVALCTDGAMTAWGSNLATLVGSTNSFVPVLVNASTNGSALIGVTPISVYAGYRRSLSLCSNGVIVAWGNNSKGELGTGEPGDPTFTVPVLVSMSSMTYGERFVAAVTGARSEHSLAVVATPPAFPEIGVEATETGALADAVGAVDFGTTLINTAGATKTFTIRNTGGADLTGLNVTKSGANASEYVLGSLGATTLAPGTSTTFTVSFMPTTVGAHVVAVQITSNDGDEAPFDITLNGNASGALTADFTSGSQIALTTNGFTATGSTVTPTLGYTPALFTVLTLVNNTSANPINGTFTNLAQGQLVTLVYNTVGYEFNADYFGGDGNDLVLVLQGPGVLDYSFNASGKVKTAIGSGNEQAWDVAVQADGKVVAVGWSYNGSSDDFAVVRYNTDGTLDSGFGTGGKVTTSIGNESDQAYGVAVQADGKIVVAGFSTNSGVQHVAVVRYNTNGTLDNTFDNDGKVVTPVGTTSEGRAVVLHEDGRIFVGGDYWNGTDTDFCVVAYNKDGSLFPDYLGSLSTLSQPGRNDEATCLKLTPDGRVYLGGYYQVGSDRVFTLARLAHGGWLDSSFGSGGWVTTQVGASDFGRALALQSNGKILLAGNAPGGGGHDAVIVRYNFDGTLDTTFDGDGLVGIAFGGYGDYAYSVELDWSGKILVGGITEDGVAENFLLARLHTNGDLDTSFHGSGKLSTSFGATSYDHAYGMALQPNGRIVLAGMASSGGNSDFALTRYLVETSHEAVFTSETSTPLNAALIFGEGLTLNPTLGFAPAPGTELRLINNTGSHPIQGTFTNIANGDTVPLTYNSVSYNFIANYSGGTGNDLTLLLPGAGGPDVTFNGSGRFRFGGSSNIDSANGIAIQPDGKVVSVGYAFQGGFNYDAVVVRHNPDGSLDGSFGVGGVATKANAGAACVALQSDGRIVLGGGGGSDFLMMRYQANGLPDNSFGNAGTVSTDFGEKENCTKLVVQKDGKIIAIGQSENWDKPRKIAVTRYNTDGTLDLSFGGTGKLLTSFAGDYDVVTDVALQEDGKLLVCGYSGGNALIRYNQDGTLDTSFGGTGRVTIPLGEQYSGGPCLCLQRDGKIIVAGALGMEFGFARYHSNGALDTNFASGGSRTVSITSGRDYAISVGIQADGKIVAGGRANVENRFLADFAAVRLDSEGNLDPSFHGGGKAMISVGHSDDFCHDMEIAPDGKIVMAGYSFNGSEDFAMARLGVEMSSSLVFNSASDVPLRFQGCMATGRTLNITLNFTPTPGSGLKVFENTSLQPISGEFVNLAQGQTVTLNYNSVNYVFVVNYFGGDGNDLVLEWAYTRLMAWGINSGGALGISGTAAQANMATQVVATPVIEGKTIFSTTTGRDFSLAVTSDGTVAAWGMNSDGQLGNGNTANAPLPVAVTMNGVLSGKKVIAVSAGWKHSLALCSDGTVAAWGDNAYGQLGNNSTLDSATPVLVNIAGVLAGRRIVAVAAGYSHSAALCSDGMVVCWGDNDSKQLGNNLTARSSVPVEVVTGGVLAGKAVKAIAAGYSHTLALCADGTVAAWGSNANKQLGNNSTANSGVPVEVITSGAFSGKFVVQIAAGGNGSMALCSDGTLAAWGHNDRGQIGNNTVGTSYGVPAAVDLTGVLAGKTITDIRTGFRHRMARCSDGTVAAWGWNQFGQLGNNSGVDSAVPVAVSATMLGVDESFAAIAGGAYTDHVVSIVSAGPPAPMIQVETTEGVILGDNAVSGPNYGGIVVGSTKSQTFIVRNTGALTLSGIAASFSGVGQSHYTITRQPATTLAPGDATSITFAFTPASYGGKPVTLSIASNAAGALNPFELNISGTGDPELYASWLTGTEIPAQAGTFDSSSKEVIFNLGFAPPTGTTLTVLNNTGTGFIDGYFDSSVYGQLVQGQDVELEYNGTTYTFVANYYGGDGNDLVLQWAGARLLAWGAGTSGSLGNGAFSNSSMPVVVNMTTGALVGKRILSVTCGTNHSVALCADGTLAAWGSNVSGQLGNNNATGNSATPVAVLTTSAALFGKVVVGIAAGADFTLALCSDGKVAAWGRNIEGQLGNSDLGVNSPVPVLVTANGALSGKIVTAVAAGGTHALARCSDGTVFGWGSNGGGQLGNGGSTNAGAPVAVDMSGVLAGKQVSRVAAGYTHSYVVCSDGTQAAWGDNGFGALGNGSTTSSTLPVLVDMSGVLAGRATAQQGAGQFHAAWLGTDGMLAAWGRNNNSQLGISTATTYIQVPFAVPMTGALAGKTVTMLAVGRQHHIALLSDGTLAAWGLAGSGQLGHGSTAPSPVTSPVAVSAAALAPGEKVVRVTSGTGALHNISMIAVPIAPPAGTPVVSTSAATAVDKTIATLNGLINPNGSVTSVYFQLGTDVSYGLPATTSQPFSGSTNQTATQNITSLEPNTIYHYRIVASYNGGGSFVYGDDQQFTTLTDPPSALASAASNVANNSATLNGSVNPNGRVTKVRFQLSTNAGFTSGVNEFNVADVSAGMSQVPVSTAVSGLLHGTTYYYRVYAENPAGVVDVPSLNVVSLTTTSVGIATQAPTISGTTAVNITTNSARLQGSVNPHGGITNVFFEYGSPPSFGTNSINYSAGSGTSPQNMTHDITGLLPATQYHFRLVAENNFNNSTTTTGTSITFTTLPLPPAVETHAAAALSTTGARMNGKVNAQNGSAMVTFEWGTDGLNFPNSLTATPSPVTGNTLTDVSVDLANLAQFTTYHFRVKATSAGGTTTGSVLTFQPQIISGLLQQFPNAPPASNGSLTVILTPTSPLNGWRFVGEHRWRASGETASGLVLGSRVIEFRPVPGYLQPGADAVNVTSSGQVADFEYFSTPSAGSGGILMVLKPDTLAQATLEADRSQWRLLGETTWRDSGTTATLLPAGSYLVECKAVAGYSTPAVASVTVSSGQTVNPTLVYFTASSPTGLAPSVQAFSTVSTDTSKPYAYVGQIRSNAGLSTGFIVKPRVVATAAHVLWDDGTLSAVQGVQWMFQRDAGTHDPVPQVPQGFYTFDGYAAQRIADNTPGQSSPQSQHLDVAVIYFNTNAGRDGYSGWLGSDLSNNEFLLSSSSKMLVGYPVDSIDPALQGRMHTTTATNISFTSAYGRTYTTSGLHSFGGNSGGPLCVQHTNGSWYPAAIYLGGTNQTVVRAIDSDVIELFNRAGTSSTGGGNNTGGGITHTGYTAGGTASTGALQINISPAGNGWRPVGSTKSFTPSGSTRSALTPGTFFIEFTPAAGYQTPANQSVLVVAGSTQTYSIDYVAISTPQESWRQTYFGSTANSGNGADAFDFDGDGFTNAAEYAADTNPTLSSDFLKAENPQRGENTFSLSAAGKADRTYFLERSSSLSANSWITLTSNGPLTADGLVTLTDSASTGGAFFYRIRVTGP